MQLCPGQLMPISCSVQRMFSQDEQVTLQQQLKKKLGPSLISQRLSATEGQRVAFVETWKLISIANELFGFNGWSTRVTSQTIGKQRN